MKTLKIHKTLFSALAISILSFSSCTDDDHEKIVPSVIPTATYNATINLTQFVDGNVLQMNTSGYPYQNALMQQFKVTKLQYLISDVTFTKDDGTKIIDEGYHFVDLTDSSKLTYTLSTKIPEGSYSSVGFTFGFDEEDNVSGAYPDLNTLSWNWPTPLGGGYHFLRLEGDYLDSNITSAEFKTHMGTARDNTASPPVTTINHFDVTLANSSLSVNSDFSFDIEMNIEEWYTNPTNWDFNVWNAPVMPIYNAQRTLNMNGPSVFTFKQ
ncbi:MAG: hypothetical protein ACJAV5_001575 [Vicingaceae bacterium]|jgi:hypothetical protein